MNFGHLPGLRALPVMRLIAIGEIALLDGGPRTATVTADTDVKLLGLTEWVFRGLVQEHPSIAVKTLQAMATRLRSATKAATA